MQAYDIGVHDHAKYIEDLRGSRLRVREIRLPPVEEIATGSSVESLPVAVEESPHLDPLPFGPPSAAVAQK
jgi:hypothetical protein